MKEERNEIELVIVEDELQCGHILVKDEEQGNQQKFANRRKERVVHR